jgi:hypothetical protein
MQWRKSISTNTCSPGLILRQKSPIVQLGCDALIADGDKTAIAAFLYGLEMSLPDLILPLYYIVSPPVGQAQAGP